MFVINPKLLALDGLFNTINLTQITPQNYVRHVWQVARDATTNGGNQKTP